MMTTRRLSGMGFYSWPAAWAVSGEIQRVRPSTRSTRAARAAGDAATRSGSSRVHDVPRSSALATPPGVEVARPGWRCRRRSPASGRVLGSSGEAVDQAGPQQHQERDREAPRTAATAPWWTACAQPRERRRPGRPTARRTSTKKPPGVTASAARRKRPRRIHIHEGMRVPPRASTTGARRRSIDIRRNQGPAAGARNSAQAGRLVAAGRDVLAVAAAVEDGAVGPRVRARDSRASARKRRSWDTKSIVPS